MKLLILSLVALAYLAHGAYVAAKHLNAVQTAQMEAAR